MANQKFLVIELQSQTASFRNPEFQNFHKTLLLPPPTTVFGMAGAAMGLSPKATQDFFDQGNWQLGIYGKAEGKGKDLWKYRTMAFEKQKKSLGLKKDDPLDLRSDDPKSIINREILYKNHFIFVFSHEDAGRLEILHDAFLSPVYALTVGNSDSLANIINVSWATDVISSRKIAHCMVAGDIVSAVMDKAIEDPEFSIYSTSEPIAYDLPVQFSYKKDYGVRSVSARKTLSIVGEAMELNMDISGISYKNHFIPVFSIR
jgi:CRISPR-associated protein Cas5t